MKFLISGLLCFTINFLYAQTPELMVPRGHSANISALAVSPDGKYLASGSWDQSVMLWNISAKKEIKSYTFFKHWVKRLEFSPDGKFLAAATRKYLSVINMETGKPFIINKEIHTDEILGLCYNENNTVLATASLLYKDEKKTVSYVEVKLWNAQTYELIKRFEYDGKLFNLKFNGNDLIAISPKSIYTINTSSGSVTKTQTMNSNDNYFRADISPNGKWFVTETFEQNRGEVIQLFNVNTGQLSKEFIAERNSATSITFSKDGRYIFAGTQPKFFVFDIESGERVFESKFGLYEANIATSANGKSIFLGGSDNVIRELSYPGFSLVANFGGSANVVETVRVSPNGKTLAVLGSPKYRNANHFLQILNLESGNLQYSYESTVSNKSLEYSKDGTLLAAGRFPKMKMWNTATGKIVMDDNTTTATEISFSPNGMLLAHAEYGENPPFIYQTNTKITSLSIKANFPKYPKSIIYNKSGSSIFAGGNSGNVFYQVDAKNGVILKTYEHKGKYSDIIGVHGLILSKDEKEIFALADYGNLYKWNVGNATEIKSIKIESGSNAFVMLPTNSKLAVGSGSESFPDTVIRIFDTNLQKTDSLTGHNNAVLSLSVKDKFLWSSSADRTVKLWNTETNKCLATLVFFEKNDWVIVDDAGRFDGTPKAMQQMYFVKGLDIIPLESAYEQFYTPALLPQILRGQPIAKPAVNFNELKPAPTVKIIYQNQRNLTVENDIPQYKTNQANVNLLVEAEAPKDKIAEIRLFQNGKLVSTTMRNLVVEDDNTAKQNKQFNLTLVPGKNIIKAISINSQRTESKPYEINIVYEAPINNDSKTNLHMLVVAVNNYKNPKYSLNYAKADAEAFKDLLEKNGNNIFADTKIIYLLNDAANKASIINAFKAISETSKPSDVFIFYYAGHGVMINEGAKKDFYIVPYDVLQLYGADDALVQKGISAAEIQEFSKNIHAQKQLFILDACQSAGAIEKVGNRGAAEEKAVSQLARSTGTHWLTASGSEQFASEFKDLGHGVFTYALLQAFGGAADSGDGQITVNELKAFLEVRVPELSEKYKGNAQYPASYGYGNDFPIYIIKK